MSAWSDICITSYVLKKGSDVIASQYVSYTVQAKRQESIHTVERRFNEFVLLQKEIAKEHPGSIIAPLPKDQVFGRFKPEFIESRMRGLEDCLRKLYGDADISKSCCWDPFFSSESFNACDIEKIPAGDSTEASPSSWVSSMQRLAAPVLVNPYLDTAEMDDRVKEIEEFVQSNSKSMQKLALTAGGLADKTMASARILKTFSEVCTAIGCNCEDEDDEFMRQFGLSIGSYSLSISRNADEQIVRVKEPLDQQARTLQSVTEALRRQKKLKSNFIACAADTILRQKAELKDPSNVSKIESSRSGRAAVLTARKEYLDASGSLLQSFENIREARMYDVLGVAEALCEVEVAACEKHSHVLADILDELTCDGAC